jgi:hypothetical protein
MSGSIAALFQRLTQGVYIVGVAHGEVRNAFTAAWVMQVSYDPASLGDTLFLTRSVDGLFPMSNVSYWYRAHVAVSQSMSDIGVRTDIA